MKDTDEPMVWPAFHQGEIMLHQRAGLADRMAEVGHRTVRRFMPEQHREFFAQLPYLVVGALDEAAQPWASVLYGPAGFVQSPLDTQLDIAAAPLADDPLAGRLVSGAPIGLLGIEAHTRRRNRANGHVLAASSDGMSLRVLESFGNCPKYIQARSSSPTVPQSPAPAEAFVHLSDQARAVIARADTFFIASAHPDALHQPGYGVDVSHRGGNPGFVHIERTGTSRDQLLVPDFAGNYFFNTFGNIALNPRVGLLFIDYESQDLVHLAGRAELILDGAEVDRYAGARRLLRITIERGLCRHNVLPLAWGHADPSPHLSNTGPW